MRTQLLKPAQQKHADRAHALAILEAHKEVIANGKALVQISTEYGKGTTDYLRVAIFYPNKEGEVIQSHLTWAIAKEMGYSLRDRAGRWYLALNGGGYSKAYEIALSLARFYGVEKIRFEEN
jgi:hypothetical protein